MGDRTGLMAHFSQLIFSQLIVMIVINCNHRLH